MIKAQLREELFRVKGLLRDALLEEGFRNGTESEFYKFVFTIWKDMNRHDYC